MTERHASSVAPFVISVALSAAVAEIAWVRAPFEMAAVSPALEQVHLRADDHGDEPVTLYVALPPPDTAPVYIEPVLPVPVPRWRPSAAIRDSALIDRARKYLGTNPTGWARVWCGRFMALIAPDLARRVPNPNWARDWARLPHVKPRVGAIVVLTRRGGGHVGVVSGFDRRGNPVVVSGNHNRRVAESVYPKSRVVAYVSASSS